MLILNKTALHFAAVPTLVFSEGPKLTVVAKGTFRLVPDGIAEEHEEPLPLAGDVHPDDDAERPYDYEADFAPFKPCADLLLTGTAHAPGGQPTSSMDVTFAVADQSHTLRVSGDAEWQGGLLSQSRSDPAPFTELELGYEHAFGGPGFDGNPSGKGAADIVDEDGEKHRPLPNIEDPLDPVRSPRHKPAPAGFGPVPRSWSSRTDLMGRFSRRYRERDWPALPDDFDWGYFNCAPPEMQAEGYLRGDESLRFENLHPDHPVYTSTLPGVRPRCFLEDERDDVRRHREVFLELDTLWVDADAEQLVLVWRGTASIATTDAEEVHVAYLVSEAVADEPRPAKDWIAQLEQERVNAEEAPPPKPEKPPGEEDEAEFAKMQAAMEVEFAKARAQLSAVGLPESLVSKLGSEADLEAFAEGVAAHLGISDDVVQAATEQRHQALRDQLEAAGENPDVVDQLLELEPDPIEREVVESRHESGEGLAGEDLSELDLAGIDLAGADLAGAILNKTNLAGANLGGADLSKAVMHGCDLSGASLSGANLAGADFSGANMTEVDLSGATLESAIGDGVVLVGAQLVGVNAGESRLPNADLSGSNWDQASLGKANLSSSTLDGASFKAADLSFGSIEGAHGEQVDMTSANLNGLRASEGARLAGGIFSGCQAEHSMWSTSSLPRANFASSQMTGADFSACDLVGANFEFANLGGGNLRKANLEEALCMDTNLFQANLEQARLVRTDLSGANLFEAELLDVDAEDVVLAEANLKRSKFEGMRA